MDKKAKSLLHHSKKRARRKQIENTLTIAWVREKLKPGVCELTKIPFDYAPGVGNNTNPFCASIDRIDSTKGYTADNCRVILFCVNSALNSHGLETMKPIFKILAEL